MLSAARPISADLVRDLTIELKRLTTKTWKVTTADVPGAPTLREQDLAAKDARRAAILATPVIKAAFDAFPGAEFPEEELDRIIDLQRSEA
ncbi:hypothetical protein BH10PSE15_BH10PSE15_19480 [soil metagenome]